MAFALLSHFHLPQSPQPPHAQPPQFRTRLNNYSSQHQHQHQHQPQPQPQPQPHLAPLSPHFPLMDQDHPLRRIKAPSTFLPGGIEQQQRVWELQRKRYDIINGQPVNHSETIRKYPKYTL
jgi:hypothetical protein